MVFIQYQELQIKTFLIVNLVFNNKINGNLDSVNSDIHDIDYRLIRGDGYTSLEVPNADGTLYRLQLSANGGLAHLYQNSGNGWQRTDTLALKSDLSYVIGSLGTKAGNYDFDLLTQSGYYYIGNSGDAHNAPPGAGTGVLVVYNVGNNDFIIQTFFTTNTFAVRHFVKANNNTWYEWKGIRVGTIQ